MITASDIRSKRARLNISRNELAEKAGLGLSTIVKLEDDDRGPNKSTFESVVKIADALDLPLENKEK